MVAPALGDIWCWASDCDIGQSLVQEMSDAYASLSAQVGDSFRRRFQTAKEALEAQLAAALAKRDDRSWWELVAPDCCIAKTIGTQAQALTAQMYREAGAAAPGSVDTRGPTDRLIDTAEKGATSVFDVVKWVAIVLAGLGGLYVIVSVTRRRR